MYAQKAQIFTASTTAAWIEHFDLLISKYRCLLEPTREFGAKMEDASAIDKTDVGRPERRAAVASNPPMVGFLGIFRFGETSSYAFHRVYWTNGTY